jgi:hypothetical protein
MALLLRFALQISQRDSPLHAAIRNALAVHPLPTGWATGQRITTALGGEDCAAASAGDAVPPPIAPFIAAITPGPHNLLASF